MADLYLVKLARGPDWDHARHRREQDGWGEHAAFMDGLVDEGFIVLGGPLGDEDGEHTLHVVDAEGGRDTFPLRAGPVGRRHAHD